MKNIIGDSWKRVDASAKVTGQASYIADESHTGMLYGKVLRSPHAHARIKALNVEKAQALAGVQAVVTGRDFPYLHGEAIVNIPFLAIDKVRYVGEPVAAVAASDPAIAERALTLIEATYDELPAVFDPEAAIKPEAPLIHEDLGKYPAISAVNLMPGTNICQHFSLCRGDIENGFQQGDYVFEDRYETPRVQHAAVEPHACIAMVDVNGHITVWGQNDSPHRCRKEIAQALGVPQAKVRVVTGYVGGNFGGKGGVKTEAIAIALAFKLRGRPIQVVFSREEVFLTISRLACVVYLKTGVARDGALRAQQVRIIWDNGAYAEKGPTIALHGGSLSSGPYQIPNVQVESFTAFTNKPPTGAMRGYGLPQVTFAYESQMDMIAEKLGMHPLEFRMKNAVDEGSQVVTGQRLYSVGVKECLARVEAELFQKDTEPVGKRDDVMSYGRWVKGKGVACTYKSTKTPTVSAAYVKIDEDASASIVTSTIEVGQGSHTILIQIVADVLGLPKDMITVSFADTDVTPYDTSTTASRSTFHMGNAVRLAAEDAKQQVLRLAAPILEAQAGSLQLRNGCILAPDRRSLTIEQVLKSVFGAGAGAAVLGQAVFKPEDILGLEDMQNKKLEAFSTMSAFHGYAVQGAEVMVNLDTGEVEVLRVVAAHDVGKAINPDNCRQQIEGAIAMGLGFALSEEFIWQKGSLLSSNFLNYQVLTAVDVPAMKVYLVEKPHPQGPFGAKGMGEIACTPTAPAIANAVYNACGVRIYDLPIKPEKILKGLKSFSAAS